MKSKHPAFPARLVAAALAGSAVFAVAGAHPAAAQGRLEAQYEASLAGIAVGKGAWNIEIGEDSYAASAIGGTSGILKTIANGSGDGEAQGRIINGALVPANYKASTTTAKKSETIHITLANGNVKEFGIDPVPLVDADRVPVTEAHRQGIIDPMSAWLMPVGGNGDPVRPEACQRTLPVFDGRGRFDLALSFKRMERVRAERGYAGPVVVCSVRYQPISGHRPTRAAVKYLMAQRDIEVALAPVAGTRVLVPFRVSVPTALGPAVLEATEFITGPQIARPAPPTTNAKTF